MSKSKTRSSRWKFQADELMFSVLCAVDCSYFAFTEFFDLRIFVLTHDLEVTLVLVLPRERTNVILTFFFEHLVNDPAHVSA